MLYTAFLIVGGLVLVGILSAILVSLGMKDHPGLARLLAAVCVIITGYTHIWIPLMILVVAATVFMIVRGELQHRAQRRNQSA